MPSAYTLRLTLSWAFFLFYIWSGVLFQMLYIGGTLLALAFKVGGWGAALLSFIGHAILIVLFFSCFQWLLKKPGNASQDSYEFSMKTSVFAAFTVPLIWAITINEFHAEVLIPWWFCLVITTNVPIILSMYFHGYRISRKRNKDN